MKAALHHPSRSERSSHTTVSIIKPSIMELLGKTTINPIIFYTGKISGFITWAFLFLMLFGIELINKKIIYFNNYFAASILFIGFIFIVISLINLGKSTRVGLPQEDTTLKTTGIYKISRNPMYVGVHLITIASMVYILHWIIIVLGIFSLITYHLIIKGEESFLTKRFGEEYKQYKSRVRKYL